MNGSARHPAAGVVEQRRLVVEPPLRREHGDPGGEVVAALDDGDAAQELRRLDHRRRGVVEERLPAVLDDRPVADVGTGCLAQPQQQHLHEAALVAAAEHRVGLDPVAHDDVVGVGGEAVLPQRDAERRAGHLDDVHRRPDRAADGVLGHAVGLEHRPLAVGGAAAVAAHRRYEERLRAEAAQVGDDGAQHRDDVGDAPAAAGDRDGVAATDPARRGAGRPARPRPRRPRRRPTAPRPAAARAPPAAASRARPLAEAVGVEQLDGPAAGAHEAERGGAPAAPWPPTRATRR